MPTSFLDEFSVFVCSSLDSILDSGNNPSSAKKAKNPQWLPVTNCLIDDERKYLKLSIAGGGGGGARDVIALFDNMTFIYRPDGVAVDRFVHPAAIATKPSSSSAKAGGGTTTASTETNSSGAFCGIRVAGGTKANNQQQTVNHLGQYMADSPLILYAPSNDTVNRFLSTLTPLLTLLHDPSIIRSDVKYVEAPKSSPGFFKTFARSLVSRQKKRFTEGNFNLDLAYISQNLIAMGYPTPPGEAEANYRNDMSDVFQFFSTRHREQYWVINLCSERAFPPSCFGGRFSRLNFEDHEAPPLQLLFDLCQCMEMFLASGRPMVSSIRSNALAPFLTAEERSAFWRQNPPGPSEDLPGACGRVIAVHCKAGKGRTGVSLSAWIFYERLMRALHAPGVAKTSVVPPDVEACARLFGEQRSQDGSGVTIVSQMRFLRYFSRCCCELGMSLPPTIRPVQISSVTINATPALDGEGGSRMFVIVRTYRRPQIWERMGRREWLGRGMKASALMASPSQPPMNSDDQVTLATVADSRIIQKQQGGRGEGEGGGGEETVWVVAGSRITIPLGNVQVEDEFHISVWHAGSGPSKMKVGGGDDEDDEDFQQDDVSPPSSPASNAATAAAGGGGNNNKSGGIKKYLTHGQKGEFMACACWLHSSFLEFKDGGVGEEDENDQRGGSGGAAGATKDGSGRTSTVSLGLRQLDGCSKGKIMDFFEENFGIEIELTSCKPRARTRSDF